MVPDQIAIWANNHVKWPFRGYQVAPSHVWVCFFHHSVGMTNCDEGAVWQPKRKGTPSHSLLELGLWLVDEKLQWVGVILRGRFPTCVGDDCQVKHEFPFFGSCIKVVTVNTNHSIWTSEWHCNQFVDNSLGMTGEFYRERINFGGTMQQEYSVVCRCVAKCKGLAIWPGDWAELPLDIRTCIFHIKQVAEQILEYQTKR